jgi:hypothetical protein
MVVENGTSENFLDKDSDSRRNLDGEAATEESLGSIESYPSKEWQELMGKDLLLKVRQLHFSCYPLLINSSYIHGRVTSYDLKNVLTDTCENSR